MKGKIVNKNEEWFIEYTYSSQSSHGDLETDFYPIYPDDYFNRTTFHSNEVVNFEIITKYVEPDESIHCNRGADVKFARILPYELTGYQKINILEGLLHSVKIKYSEFNEEHTTGWDIVEGAELWLLELKEKHKTEQNKTIKKSIS